MYWIVKGEFFNCKFDRFIKLLKLLKLFDIEYFDYKFGGLVREMFFIFGEIVRE